MGALNDRYLLALRQITNIQDKTINDLERVAFAMLDLSFPNSLSMQARLALLEGFSLDLVIYTRAEESIEDRFGDVILRREV